MIWILAIPFMAWASRMCGGGRPALPFGLSQWLFPAPYIPLLVPHIGWWAVLAYLGAVLGKKLGHGEYMDLGSWKQPVSPERVDFLVQDLTGTPDTWNSPCRDYVGLIIDGLAVTLWPALALACAGQIWAALTLFSSGSLMSVAYDLGWYIFSVGNSDPTGFPKDLNSATAWGEFYTGLFCGFGVAVVAVTL